MTFRTVTTTTPAPDENGETHLYFKAVEREIDSLSPADKKNRCNYYIDGILSGDYPGVKPSAENVVKRIELFRDALEPGTRTPGTGKNDISGLKPFYTHKKIWKELDITKTTFYDLMDTDKRFKNSIKEIDGYSGYFIAPKTLKFYKIKYSCDKQGTFRVPEKV